MFSVSHLLIQPTTNAKRLLNRREKNFQTTQGIEALTGKLYSKMKNLVSLDEKSGFPKAYKETKDSFS